MPGPVSRGDVASIEKHVAALDGLGPEMMAFYRILCGSTVKLALGNGVIDAATAAHFTAALEAEKPGAQH
jgi:predicted short-subunit dehydrogenase-like oxidoreductase (DUF2520 family)